MPRFLHPAAWVVLAAAALWSFWLDVENVTQGGGLDLRNRITGVRLLEDQVDPYHYKWRSPEPEIYLDPYNNPRLAISKTTATPALLLVHAPLAAMPYRLAQFIWLPLQWTLLLAAGVIWLRSWRAPGPRLALAALVVGFTYTAAWRLHAERGQIYVLFLFLAATWFALTRSTKWKDSFAAGFVAGLLAALRPPFLLLFPFLALHRRRQLPGAAAGLVLGLVAPLFLLPSCWTQYLLAMETHSALYRAQIDPRPGPQDLPDRIEGIPRDILGGFVDLPFADFSVHGFFRWMNWAPLPAWPFEALFLALFLAWLAWKRARPWDEVLAGLAAWLFLVDLALPAFRNSYNDVVMLNALALGLVSAPRISLGVGLGFLALPFGWAIAVFSPRHNWMIDLPSLLLTASAIALLFTPVPLVFWRGNSQPAPMKSRRSESVVGGPAQPC